MSSDNRHVWEGYVIREDEDKQFYFAKTKDPDHFLLGLQPLDFCVVGSLTFEHANNRIGTRPRFVSRNRVRITVEEIAEDN